MNNLRTITSPYNGQAVRPIIKQKVVGKYLITEAHYTCTASGQFITKVEVSREEQKPTTRDPQLVQEMFYEETEGVPTKEFFRSVSSFANLITKRLKGVPDEVYTIISVIRNGLEGMKGSIDLPNDDTAYTNTYKPIRVNLPISDTNFKIGGAPRVAILPTLENFKTVLTNSLAQITTRGADGDLEPTKVIYTEQAKLLYRIIDLVEDAIDRFE